ncbi:structure-specific endonuclease subunit SLX4 isoform X2 [Hyperolius riggenbachi]|uniref:structure-specific endonuclease subunit SLX4 isoform X2 n=1 Tax=Hyperolius riggenbachi TaxID=752182 RepID=UPI0035A38070
MLESDDEFTELCSKLLKRVKKSKPLEGQSVSTADNAAKSKRKRTKPPKPKSQASNGASKEAEPSIRTASGPEMPSDGDGAEKVSAVQTHLHSDGHTNKDGNAGGPQEEAARLEEQPNVKHLVLERMQQYKRSSPVRMTLNPTEADGEHDTHRAEADVRTDGELAMALQMDLKRKPPSLEDEGLFFCQLCHKDLTTMSGSLREQHVNRCLDQGESVQSNPVAPEAPSCPLCGKFFATKKTRAAHLKRCAAKLGVPAQDLLEAVKRQAAETGSEKPPRVPSVKRKGVSKPKEPSKKRKVAQTGAEREDLMVAMALSRSLQEESITSNTVRALPTSDIAPPEKKRRRKQKDKPTPLLLLQAPEEAVVKLQKRISMMLSEEQVGDSLVTLPASHFWSVLKEDRETWTLQAGDRCVFWDISNMTETRENASYYTAELNPPITPWKGPSKKLPGSGQGAFPPVTPIKPRRTPTSQKHRDKDMSPAVPCRRQSSPSNSQKDKQALQDLVDLAGEGMTLTQWNSVPSTGRESPSSIVCSGFIPSEEEEPRREGLAPDTNTSALTTLTTDFMEMVNNPHLSDAQLQTDCGEVLNVHMFVLYARCPLLVEAVHTEGFWVKEGSTGRVRRLLLNNVSAEAVMSFLCFLYSAKTDVPSDCLPHICELARRFGVNSLIDICEVLVGKARVTEDMVPFEKEDEEEDEEEDDGGERAENFQELLKSMWVDEDEDLFHDSETEGIGEEEKVDDGRVEEMDLDEIYEFAATQRKMAEERDMESGSSRVLKHSSPTARCQTVGNGEQHLDEVNRPPVESNEPIYIADNSPSKVLGVNKGVTGSPFGKTPVHPHSRNVQLSPAVHRLGSPAQSKTQQAPGFSPSRCLSTAGVSPSRGHSTSGVSHSRCQGIQGVSPSKCHSTPGISLSRCHSTSSKPPFRQLPVNERSKSSEGPSGNLSDCSAQILDTISLISPEREEDPEADLFTPHSPSALEDSYDRLFLETCGEYVEPSDLSETNPQMHQTTPQHEPPILTSSPSVNQHPTLPELGSSPNIQSPKPSQNASNSVAKNGQSSLSSPKCGSSTQNSSCKAFSASQSQGDIILIGSSDEEDSTQVAEGKGQSNRPGACKVIKKLPSSFSSIRKSSEGNSRLQMSSSSDTSWLVPATPMPHSTGAGVSQLHASRLSQSPQTPKPRSQNELRQSFGSPTQKHLSPIRPAITPKKPLFFNKPPCSKAPEKVTKACSSTSSKVSCVPSSPLSSTASSTVFEIVDSDEEKDPVVKPQTDNSACSFQMDYDEPPIPVQDDMWLNPQETPTKPRSSTQGSTSLPINLTPTKGPESSCTITALQERDKAPHNKEQSPNKPPETDKEPDNPKDSAIILQKTSKEHNNRNDSSFKLQKRDKEPDNRVDSPFTLPEKDKEPDNRADSPLILPEIDKELDSRADSPLILPETDKEPDDDEEDSPSSLPDTDKEPDDEEDSPSSLPDTDKEPDDEEDFPFSLPDTDKEPDDEEDSPSSLPETDKEPDDEEDSPSTPASQSSRQSYLNSKLWDEWDDELPELPEVLPLSQRINQVPSMQKELKTPVSKVRKRELAPKVPITPQPGYSDMDTPVLKKELNKFGVRGLPKKQMVLKLKEIYHYTHQVMSSDSEEDMPSSQPGHRSLSSSSAQYRHLPAAAGTSKTSSTALLQMAKKSTSVCAAQEADSGDDQPSQESTASSVAASDTSSISHSSNTNEFETAFADEDDDLVPPSQAASKEAQTAEAVRKFIEQRPDLHKRILLYQPLDLAALHAELKLNGIKMASGKLLDFLDAHCVTFTTAAARKEKKSRVRKRFGKQPGTALKKSSAKN